MLQKYNPKNDSIKIHIGGQLFNREDAKISVFDSTVQGGDAVWEGLRIYDGKIFCLEEHLDRLQNSAKILAFTDIPSKETIKKAIFETLEANNMRDKAHIRLTLSRGEKITSGMDPRLNQVGSCLIVLAEWKEPVYDNMKGITLITSSIRRNNPQFLDSKIHHNNLLNNILAKIEANYSNADDAVMLDKDGFVAETNATNLFMIKGDTLYSPHAHACLPGITRANTLKISRELKIETIEINLSIAEFYTADVVFTTSTMGELTPVHQIDGRTIENRSNSTVLSRIQTKYRSMTMDMGTPLPF